MTTTPYDFTLVSAANTPIDAILVFNYWTDNLLFTGACIVFTLILFAGTRYAEVEIENALIYSTFFGAIISIFAWLLRYNGEPTVPTVLPILMIFFLAGAVFYKQMNKSISQID